MHPFLFIKLGATLILVQEETPMFQWHPFGGWVKIKKNIRPFSKTSQFEKKKEIYTPFDLLSNKCLFLMRKQKIYNTYSYIYIYIKKRSLDCDLFCYKAQRKRLEQEINVECFPPLLDSGTELASCNIKLVVEGPTDRVLNTNPIVRHSKFHRKDTSRPLHFERTFD